MIKRLFIILAIVSPLSVFASGKYVPAPKAAEVGKHAPFSYDNAIRTLTDELYTWFRTKNYSAENMRDFNAYLTFKILISSQTSDMDIIKYETEHFSSKTEKFNEHIERLNKEERTRIIRSNLYTSSQSAVSQGFRLIQTQLTEALGLEDFEAILTRFLNSGVSSDFDLSLVEIAALRKLQVLISEQPMAPGGL